MRDSGVRRSATVFDRRLFIVQDSGEEPARVFSNLIPILLSALFVRFIEPAL